MATLSTAYPTLLDVAKRSDPSGQIMAVAEILNQTNEILDDAVVHECNDGTGNITTVRTGIPAGTWRKLNYGVQPTKSRTAQIRDTTGMLENYAKVDKALADLNGNTAAFRMSEDKAFIEGMSQDMASTFFNGDTDVNPERFLGLAPRYDDNTTAESKDNVILGGGAGSDNTSIYLVGWSPETVSLLYPKGSKAGLSMRDLGEDTATDANGLEFQILRTHYKWDIGLCVRDWRYVVRIANIDKSDLTKNAATGADLVDLMVQAIEQAGAGASVRWAFYVNRSLRSWLRRQMMNKTIYQLTMENIAGKHVMAFDGIPVRRSDMILNTEATIS